MARSNSRARSYVPFKWTKELIIFLSVLAVAIILTIICLIPTSEEKFMTEWSNAITAASGTALEEDHVFKYISLSNLEKEKEKATAESPLIILYGSPDDSTTASNISSINTKAKQYEVEKIYIFNCDFVLKADDTDSKDKAKLEDYKEALGFEEVEDLNTYCQLLVYTGNSQPEFSSKEIIEDKNNADADFAKAMTKCFSTYSPKALALKK